MFKEIKNEIAKIRTQETTKKKKQVWRKNKWNH